MLINTRE